jgi:3-oxoisoapionate kinase
LIATAQGPDDPAVANLRTALRSSRLDPAIVNERIGAGLGEILKRLIRESGVKRGAISGGDSSGFAMRTLGAYALEAIAPIAPGAPLCRLFSTDPIIDGFEISLKGGQMGETNFFGSVRTGCKPTNGGKK